METVDFRYSECKEKFNELFYDDSIKAKYFDELASFFFDRNFGSASKSEIELYIFNILMKQLIDKNEVNGTIDYTKCSDYSISKLLGISESKIRNLKIRKNLVYPEKYSWIDSFASILNNSKLTRKSNEKVLITIPDPNVMIEVKNYLEENGEVVEKHLNSKILEIDIKYLLLFAIKFEEEHIGDSELIKNLRNEYAQYVKDEAFNDLRQTSEIVNKLCHWFSVGNKIFEFVKLHKTDKN